MLDVLPYMGFELRVGVEGEEEAHVTGKALVELLDGMQARLGRRRRRPAEAIDDLVVLALQDAVLSSTHIWQRCLDVAAPRTECIGERGHHAAFTPAALRRRIPTSNGRVARCAAAANGGTCDAN